MMNIFKRKRVLYILPLLSVSLFTIGFSSWSFINTSEQYSNFNVYASTGTVIDISDCIALNGEITNIGTHDELLKTSELYREMVHLQSLQEEVEGGQNE